MDYLNTPAPGEIREKFKQLLAAKASWVGHEEDYIADAHGAHLEFYLDAFFRKANRLFQEFFGATALNDTSILAKVQDAAYVPTPPSPCKVRLKITNKAEQGGASISYPFEQPFLSETGAIYLIQAPVVALAPQAFVLVEAHQLEKSSLSYSSAGGPLQEVLIGDSSVAIFEVKVAGTLWTKGANLLAIDETSQTFIPFYTLTGNLSARFGNDVLGKAPVAGQSIEITIYKTLGKAGSLLVGAGLEEYNVAQASEVLVQVDAVIQAGADQETPEQMLKALPFHELSKGAMGWGDDYRFTVLKYFPAVVWARVWGQAEHEAMTGIPSIDNINNIFVSALWPGNQVNAQSLILPYLKAQKNPVNVKFVWLDPVVVNFNLTLTGKVDKNINIEAAKATIGAALAQYYGEESRYRRVSLIQAELDELIKGLGVFTDQLPHLTNRIERPWFTAAVSGQINPALLNEVIALGTVTYNLTALA